MSSTGARPETGFRLELERPRDGGPPWSYVGEVETTDGLFELSATIDAEGQVALDETEPRASVPPGVALRPLDASVAEKVRLVLRTAFKQAAGDGLAPARKIVRWRGDK